MRGTKIAGAAGAALGMAGALLFGGPAAAQDEQAPAATTQEPEAQAQPLWELRFGGSTLYAPDYPGADQYHWRGVGAPLFIYRGKRLRIGSDEPNSIARAIAVDEPRFQLDLSVDANYGIDSDDNDARTGMPDLDPQLEIGPQIVLNMSDTGWTEYGRERVRFLLPVRAVAASDFKNFEELGYIVQPTLTYRRQFAGERRMSFSTWFAVAYASEGVQDYYYEVDPQFATVDRPEYQAKGGYLGTHMQISGMREIKPGLNVYLTYRLRSLDGAANEDSPLHRSELTQAFSISAVWTAFRSERSARDGE